MPSQKAKPTIPKNKLAVVEQRVGRTRKKQVLEINIDEITHLQVCMAGAKLGNTHREGDRELGVILPRSEISGLTDKSLIIRLEHLRLKPRQSEDYDLQQDYGIEAVPWRAPIGAEFVAPDEVEFVGGADVPESVRKAMGIEKIDDDEEDEEEENALPNFKPMKKDQVQAFMTANKIQFAGTETKKKLVARIHAWYAEEDE